MLQFKWRSEWAHVNYLISSLWAHPLMSWVGAGRGESGRVGAHRLRPRAEKSGFHMKSNACIFKSRMDIASWNYLEPFPGWITKYPEVFGGTVLKTSCLRVDSLRDFGTSDFKTASGEWSIIFIFFEPKWIIKFHCIREILCSSHFLRMVSKCIDSTDFDLQHLMVLDAFCKQEHRCSPLFENYKNWTMLTEIASKTFTEFS